MEVVAVRTSQGVFRPNPQSGLQQPHRVFSQGVPTLGQINTKVLQEGPSGRLFIICQEVSKGHLREVYGRRSGEGMLFQFTSPDRNHAGFLYIPYLADLHSQFWT